MTEPARPKSHARAARPEGRSTDLSTPLELAQALARSEREELHRTQMRLTELEGRLVHLEREREAAAKKITRLKRRLKAARREVRALRASRSYRIGNALLIPAAQLRRAVRYLRTAFPSQSSSTQQSALDGSSPSYSSTTTYRTTDAGGKPLQRQRQTSAAPNHPFSWHSIWHFMEYGNRDVPFPPHINARSPKERAYLFRRHVKPRFVHHTEYQTPPPNLAFCTVCNDKFAPGLEALLLSLLAIYPNLRNDFIVFHDGGLSLFSQRRLRAIYPSIEFIARDPLEYGASLGDAVNHRRIGVLGYLSIESLKFDKYDRIIFLDSDLLILDDISPLWTGDELLVVPDAGVRPFSIVSSYTGRPVFNSGVLSIPKELLGPHAYERALRTLNSLSDTACDVLAQYVDQRFWNIFFMNDDLRWLPNNFNANKALVERFYPEQLATISVLHMTGPKPWFSFVNGDLLQPGDKRAARLASVDFPQTFTLWTSTYKRHLARHRKSAFHEVMDKHLTELECSAQGARAVMIGNGPSLADTDLRWIDVEDCTFVFNWFVLHDDFDVIKPDYLILASHMFYGGWHTTQPVVPAEFLEALHARSHRPVIWTSFYFREFIEASGVFDDFDVRYFLFEKPFKEHADKLGYIGMDLHDFLTDNRTGVLTAGIPIAVHLAVSEVILVGCDASYGISDGNDYFYDQSLHASPTTRLETLQSAWEPGGAGHFCYQLAAEALAERGIKIRDATLAPGTGIIPKVSLSELVS